MNAPSMLEQLTMNPDDLYLEDSFSDQRAGHIRRLQPVTAEGAPDPNRSTRYIGSTQIMTPAGPLPLSFELAADSVGEAARQFAGAAEKAIEEAMEELKRLQREQQSSIVVPGQGGPGQGGLPGGGLKL
jgi:hypothetical protein